MNVYLIRQGEDGPIKVGLADNPKKRLSELQVGNPVELFLIEVHQFKTREEASQLEKEIYKKCYKFHIRGEWYKEEIIDAIQDLESIEYDPNYHDQFKKIPVGYKLPAWMVADIKTISEKSERTQNALIEEGIRYVLKKNKHLIQ